MHNRKVWALLSGAVTASLVVAACAPAPQQVVVTSVVTQEVVRVETQQVVQTVVAPTATPQLSFTTPHPILGDLRVRQAIAFCADRDSIIASVYPYVEDKSVLRMDSFLPTGHWAHTSPSTQYEYDPAKGQALLEEAGWTRGTGAIRTNANGENLALKFTTTNAQFRQTWGAVFIKNLTDCGFQVVPFYTPGSWWFGATTGLSRRDFDMGAFAWVGQADPGGVTLYACDSIPRPENGWEGQNYMGWCNTAASTAIKLANNSLSRDERIRQYAIVQEEFAKDMPSLPMFNRVEVAAYNSNLVGFEQAPGEAYYTWNIHNFEIPGKDTIVLAFTQEPASMFSLVESAAVQRQAANIVFGAGTNSLNYDFKALLYKQLPTIENGGAVNADVDVAAGTKVVDANGDVVELAAGVKVVNSAGETVEFTGGTVKMKQLTITGSFLDGIKWQDGEPLKKADIKLSFDINCDRDSGAVSFFTCDRTASFEVLDDTTSKWTLVPGYQDPQYFLNLPGAYPSHQVTSDGRTLASVPAKEWSTLPEIAERPLGFGPYRLVDWQKGIAMTFEAYEDFVLGAPKTPNIIIQFFSDTNAAVSALLTGQADVVGSETLGAGAEVATVVQAEADGKNVKVYIGASATWEHVDFQLFVR